MTPQITMQDIDRGLIITIHSHKNRFFLGILALWLVILLVIFIFAGIRIADISSEDLGRFSANPMAPSGKVMLTLFIVPFLIIFYYSALTFLWQLVGREVILVDEKGMLIVRNYGLFRTSASYERSGIDHIEIQSRFNPLGYISYGDRSDGIITFNYQNRLKRCGPVNDTNDAETILKKINSKYPDYFKA